MAATTRREDGAITGAFACSTEVHSREPDTPQWLRGWAKGTRSAAHQLAVGALMDWSLIAILVVLVVMVIGPFLLAKTGTMRGYLAGVLIFGIVCGVVEQYIAHGPRNGAASLLDFIDLMIRDRKFGFEILGGAVGWASVYMLIATLIVHPWRRRAPGKRPAYVAAGVVLVIFSITSLGGQYARMVSGH